MVIATLDGEECARCGAELSEDEWREAEPLLYNDADRGYDLAITPDGPRGPRYVVQDGAMALAQVTGLPLVPASYQLRWKIQLKSWDRFQIPLPFSRCDVFAGRIISVPRKTTDAEREELRKQFEAELRALTRD